jgi:hypothetical protein
MIKEFWEGFSNSFAVAFGWLVDILNVLNWNWEVVGILTAFCIIVVGGLSIFILILNKLFEYLEDTGF